MRSVLEPKWQNSIKDFEHVVTWLVECAALLLNTREVREDWKAACERLKGKRCVVLGFELGQKIIFRKSAKQRAAQALSLCH